MDVQNQRWVTIHVACSSIVARRGGNVRKIEFPCRQSKLRRRGANTAHTAPARAHSCTKTPVALKTTRSAPTFKTSTQKFKSNPANWRKVFTLVKSDLSFFFVSDFCVHGGLIKGLWVWRRPSWTWVSLMPDHINLCSFHSSLKVTSLRGRFCVLAILRLWELKKKNCKSCIVSCSNECLTESITCSYDLQFLLIIKQQRFLRQWI